MSPLTRLPSASTGPGMPPARRPPLNPPAVFVTAAFVTVAFVTVLLVGVVAGCTPTRTQGSATGRSAPTSTRSSTTERRRPSTTNTSPTDAPDTTDTTTASVGPSTAPPTPAAAGTVLVTGVIDGDTIDVDTGERVRLIGVDTPERGRCGAKEATLTTISLVANKAVVLIPGARTDKDRYGRILRYVEVDGLDLGLELLRRGRAIARYDSRDGYGRHPREAEYVAASPPHPVGCPTGDTPATTAAPAPAAGATGGTDPRFGSCKQAIAAGKGPYVRGVDPEYDWYRDGDGDGTVCER